MYVDDSFDLRNLKPGDVFFGAVAKFQRGMPLYLMQLWTVKRMKVVDVDENSIFVSYSAYTCKRPVKLRREKSMMYGSTKLEAWERIFTHYSSYPAEGVNKRRIQQARREMKKEAKKEAKKEMIQ